MTRAFRFTPKICRGKTVGARGRDGDALIGCGLSAWRGPVVGYERGDGMHADGIVLLAVDAALLAGIFVTLVRMSNRLDHMERRISRRMRTPRKKSAEQKKD